MAYEIASEDEQAVRDHLDFREKCGYEMSTVLFHPQDDEHVSSFEIDIYVGTQDNPHFLGPASLDDIAAHIFRSHGPSGPNSEYLLNLATSVKKELPEADDPHLFELERLVKDLVRQHGA